MRSKVKVTETLAGGVV